MSGLNSHTIRRRWKAGENVQFPAASWRRSARPRAFVLTKTTNLSIRASDRITGKVEPLVAGEKDVPDAIMKLNALYPGCDILMDF